MHDSDAFLEQIRRVLAGDAQATTDFVRQHERELLLEARLLLRENSLRLDRAFDLEDICQSVLRLFLQGAADGRFFLDHPEEVRKLLKVMTRRKLADYVKRELRLKRDLRHTHSLGPEHVEEVLAKDDSPSNGVIVEELKSEARKRLSDEEWQLVELRAQGWGWADIAAAMGGTPDARRMQHDRAVARVTRELGLQSPRPE